MSTPDVLKELAPTGTLRASINLGNIVLANGTPDNPGGVTPALARELAKRLGVPSALTCFDGAGKAFEAMKARRGRHRVPGDRAGARRRDRVHRALCDHRGLLHRAEGLAR